MLEEQHIASLSPVVQRRSSHQPHPYLMHVSNSYQPSTGTRQGCTRGSIGNSHIHSFHCSPSTAPRRPTDRNSPPSSTPGSARTRFQTARRPARTGCHRPASSRTGCPGSRRGSGRRYSSSRPTRRPAARGSGTSAAVAVAVAYVLGIVTVRVRAR